MRRECRNAVQVTSGWGRRERVESWFLPKRGQGAKCWAMRVELRRGGSLYPSRLLYPRSGLRAVPRRFTGPSLVRGTDGKGPPVTLAAVAWLTLC
jgi:hypothetical protein